MSSSASQLFRKEFTQKNLLSIYEQRISKSLAVGKDGVRQENFQRKKLDEIRLIIEKVNADTYEFTTYKPKLISKGEGKAPRKISIPTVRDRLTLRVMCDILASLFPECKTRKPHNYIRDIREVLNKTSATHYLRIDIKDFFPSINHSLLLGKLKKKIRKKELFNLYEKAIKTPTEYSNSKNVNNAKGVPQGLSISGFLSSIYLIDIDRTFKSRFNYFRYVDDIIVLGSESEVRTAYFEISGVFARCGLEIHELGEDKGKTYIDKIKNGFDYLGFSISRDYVSVRDSSIKRIMNNILKILTVTKYKKGYDKMIWRLNLKITGCIFKENRYGWVFFFQQIDDKKLLMRLDNFVRKEMEKREMSKFNEDIKTFVKAYHEIRYNSKETEYIPNFDKYTIDEMKDVIAHAEGKSPSFYARLEAAEVAAKFDRIINRETSELENDLIVVS